MSDRIKSRLGYEYDLKEAMRSNPTIITAGDDIMAVALARIEALEAENARLRGLIIGIKKQADEWCISRMTGNPQLENQKGETMWQAIRRASASTAPIEGSAALKGE